MYEPLQFLFKLSALITNVMQGHALLATQAHAFAVAATTLWTEKGTEKTVSVPFTIYFRPFY